jgi:hypothetical protein
VTTVALPGQRLIWTGNAATVLPAPGVKFTFARNAAGKLLSNQSGNLAKKTKSIKDNYTQIHCFLLFYQHFCQFPILARRGTQSRQT